MINQEIGIRFDESVKAAYSFGINFESLESFLITTLMFGEKQIQDNANKSLYFLQRDIKNLKNAYEDIGRKKGFPKKFLKEVNNWINIIEKQNFDKKVAQNLKYRVDHWTNIFRSNFPYTK